MNQYRVVEETLENEKKRYCVQQYYLGPSDKGRWIHLVTCVTKEAALKKYHEYCGNELKSTKVVYP